MQLDRERAIRIADRLLVPFVFPAAALLKGMRRLGVQRIPASRAVLDRLGVFPIRNHYYEPYFDSRELYAPLDQDRHLPGIDWNEASQLKLLHELDYRKQLTGLDRRVPGALKYSVDNHSFGPGDGEFLYSVIRHRRPRRLYEIGSGQSTLAAAKAIRDNREADPGYECEHVCIEPYEQPWLEQLGIRVIRKRVELVGLELFEKLGSGDMLFIDSSHVIRPQGDVLFEYLELLPALAGGVLVHVHDIFSPRNYPASWLCDEVRLWNEQYLLEAFLTDNPKWRVVAALNFLRHKHFDQLQRTCPYLTDSDEPGSFYIEKTV